MLARRILLALAMVVACAQMAAAQSCTTGSGTSGPTSQCSLQFSVAMTVGKTTQLTVSSTTLALANGQLSATDYIAQSKTAGTLTVTSRANSAFTVTLAAAQSNFTYAGAASNPNKAASTLSWSADNGSTWNALSTSSGTIVPSTGATSGLTTSLSFRTGLGWTTDPPGNYTLPLNFTITAP